MKTTVISEKDEMEAMDLLDRIQEMARKKPAPMEPLEVINESDEDVDTLRSATEMHVAMAESPEAFPEAFDSKAFDKAAAELTATWDVRDPHWWAP